MAKCRLFGPKIVAHKAHPVFILGNEGYFSFLLDKDINKRQNSEMAAEKGHEDAAVENECAAKLSETRSDRGWNSTWWESRKVQKEKRSWMNSGCFPSRGKQNKSVQTM